MSDPMQEIRASFFIECEELLENLLDALQTMADGKGDRETINVAFRAVHSIKGGAAAFALDDLVAFAHRFETAMDDLRAARIDAGGDLIDLFFRCSDVLADLVRAARDETAVDRTLIAPVVDDLNALGADGVDTIDVAFQPMAIDIDSLDELPLAAGTNAPEPGEAVRHFRVDFKPEPELYASGNEPLYFLRALADLGPCGVDFHFEPPEDLDALHKPAVRMTWTIAVATGAHSAAIVEIFEFAEGLCKLSIAEVATTAPESVEPVDLAAAQPETSPSPQPDGAQAAQSAPSTVRVSLERVDRLVNLVGELVINQSMLAQSVAEANLSSHFKVDARLDEFLQLTRDIQESVMMIRAQPVKSLFQRMSRIVRETSAGVGKSVHFTTDGDATEIDKTAIERLADPLTHMVRNSIDHGLEDPETRQAAGKPRLGEIRLTAAHKSGRVIIELADDGGGIDRARVRAIAVDKNLIDADTDLTDGEIDQLLFLPGFSTSAEVSPLSGRGVGLDIVKSAISALGGKVAIASEPGIGTTFSISLPLTLAVVDGMLIRVEDQTLVVPLSAVAETLALDAKNTRRVGPGSTVLCFRDRIMPLIDLGASLGYRTARDTYNGLIALMIDRDDGSPAALVIDGIDDQRQVVIKGLQDSFGHVPGISAATILGDGQIALIVDPAELIDHATGRNCPVADLRRAS